MFRLGRLNLRTLATLPMVLATLGLDPYPTAFRQCLVGMTPLPGPPHLGTEFERGVEVLIRDYGGRNSISEVPGKEPYDTPH